MAEAIAVAAVSWIGSLLTDEAKFLYGVEDQLRSLQNDLKSMQRYIQDAEEMQMEGEVNGQVAVFTETIREISFRTEHVIDTYILKVGSTTTFTRFACFLCNSFDIYVVGKQIEGIQNDIKDAAKRIQIFRNLGEPSSSDDRLKPQRSILESYAHIEEECIVGLDGSIQSLVQRVTGGMEKEQEAKGAWVLSITGQGGMGKTTLARKVYNHRDITRSFDCKAWVSISQQWNKRDVLLEILRQTRGIRNEERILTGNWSDREIIEDIYRLLKDNRYLLVLNDIWRKEAWDDISPALPCSRGSKIIITTRSHDVPRYADQNCFIHEPQLLTQEQGLELFSKLAIPFKNTRFEELGSGMIQKCDGLPLAVVILSGLLRTKTELDEWERVSKAFTSYLLKYKGSSIYTRTIDQTFQLSYHDLPYYLKPCFLYLAIFPEDYEIPARMLIQMWVAEGFVIVHNELSRDETVEDIAEQFLKELLCRCMVQVVRRNHIGKRPFVPTVIPSTSTNLRRATTNGSFSDPTQCSRQRSLIMLEPDLRSTSSSRPVCKNFKLLRVLNLWGLRIWDGILPNQIGSLIHLRYLGLRNTNVYKLPKSIGNLRNLLTLDYQVTIGPSDVAVPDVLWKMERLRHLYLPVEALYSQNTLPWKMENFRCRYLRREIDLMKSKNNKLKLDTLKNLQTLCGVYVGDRMTGELRGLGQCLRKLRVQWISSEEQFTAMFQSPCFRSGNLRNLFLNWRSESVKLESLETLYEHCQHLQKLRLEGKIGENSLPLRFPPNLVVLRLLETGLMLQDSITAIGQLRCLKSLAFFDSSYQGSRLIFDSNAFPQLEELSLSLLVNLEEWGVEDGAMPRLKRLSIASCPRLQRLPQRLCYITTLQELKLSHMTSEFCRRLRRPASRSNESFEAGEDFHIVKRIPSVQMNHIRRSI